jgi:hypothetical protein
MAFRLFVHKESQLVRVQCKTARIAEDSSHLVFNTSTVSAGGREMWKKMYLKHHEHRV